VPDDRPPEMVRAGSAHNTLQRCSRPLSRSQTTTPHRPHHAHQGRRRNRPGPCWNRSPRHTPTTHRPACTQTRPHSGHGNGPDSSEPQQCAPTPRRTGQAGKPMIPLVRHHHAPTTLKPPAQLLAARLRVGVCAP